VGAGAAEAATEGAEVAEAVAAAVAAVAAAAGCGDFAASAKAERCSLTLTHTGHYGRVWLNPVVMQAPQAFHAVGAGPRITRRLA